MGIFGKGKRNKKSDKAASQAASLESTPAPALDQAARRLRMYGTLGSVSDDVLAPIISEHLTGNSPKWPSREGHRVVTTDDGYLIFVTDGLTDTHDDGTPGLGYELMTKVPIPEGYVGIADAAATYEFGVHREMALNALVWPDLRPLLEENQVLSMVLPSDPGASPFVDMRSGQAQVGALIGAATLIGPVLVLAITLILPAELEALEQGGSETRPLLSSALDRAGVGWASIANRGAVSIA